MYEKLSGMTGTADTEAYEFQKIYGLEVVVIPTNRPMIRDDKADKVYLTQEEKFDAIMIEINRVRTKAQPILVGTASIETSELLSKRCGTHKNPTHHQRNKKTQRKKTKRKVKKKQRK